jgi:hypothetical protein
VNRTAVALVVGIAFAGATLLSTARADDPPPSSGSPATQGAGPDVPSHPMDVVLGRPTARSIAISVLSTATVDAYVSYGRSPSATGSRTALRRLQKGTPSTVTLSALQPGTRYAYKVSYRRPGTRAFSRLPASTFTTARPSGSSFRFAVQADSHLDSNSSTAVYRRTLLGELADAPDFMVDLGDTFMTDKYTPYTAAAKQYAAQRYYLGLVGRSAPVFLALGNHDGEAGYRAGGAPEGMPVWSAKLRNLYFPNPLPDGFYSGNSAAHPQAGQLRDYYAWEWGDALFVVLDPFWFTEEKSRDGDNWGWTLGKSQYDWLARTLRDSDAPLKFVFVHHLVGGEGKDSRGGAEAARYFEWGGANGDGSDGFAAHRPGWAKPIHRLLVDGGVSAVFHGHDHLFAKQDLDGIVYQEVPQPSNARPQQSTSASEYGYTSGVIMGGPGHLRVSVTARGATVDYLRTSTTAGSAGGPSRSLAHTYTIPRG